MQKQTVEGDTYRLHLIEPEFVADFLDGLKIWERLESELWRSGGRLTAKTLREQLDSGRARLWLVVENDKKVCAAFATEASPYSDDGPLVLTIQHLVGEKMTRWISLIAGVEEWAREQGCEKIEAHGRRGWRHALPGWKEAMTVIEKDL